MGFRSLNRGPILPWIGTPSISVISNEQVKSLLESNLVALKDSLEEANLQVDQIDVALSGGEDFVGSQASETSKESWSEEPSVSPGPLEDELTEEDLDSEGKSILDEIYRVNYLA